MKYPLLKDNRSKYPIRQQCAWCKRSKVAEPNSFAALVGGALYINRKTGDGGPHDKLDGFLDFIWHGADTKEGGVGKYPNTYEVSAVAKNVRGGQFELLFCSTKCLRALLNDAIDNLEKRAKRKK